MKFVSAVNASDGKRGQSEGAMEMVKGGVLGCAMASVLAPGQWQPWV